MSQKRVRKAGVVRKLPHLLPHFTPKKVLLIKLYF